MKKWQTLKNLREFLQASESTRKGRFLGDRKKRIFLNQILNSTVFDGKVRELAGKSVLLAAHDQLSAALALIELDGMAGRLVLDRKSTRLNSSHSQISYAVFCLKKKKKKKEKITRKR